MKEVYSANQTIKNFRLKYYMQEKKRNKQQAK